MPINLGLILENVPLVQTLDKPTTADDLAMEFEDLCSHFEIENTTSKALFVSVREDETYIPLAIMNRVRAILTTKKVAEEFVSRFPETIFLHSSEPRIALANLAALFFPGQPKFLAAVTGTDGKTSTVNIARQIWGCLGAKSASIGTLGMNLENCLPIPGYDNSRLDIAKVRTTFEQIDFHKLIQSMKETAEVEFLALEASSQGLYEHRLDGVKFQVGVFTNFTQDHLDYHGTREKYLESKCYLFQELILPGGIMILNNSLLTTFETKTILLKIASEKKLTVWTYGTNCGDLHFKTESSNNPGQVVLSLWGNDYSVNVPESFRPFSYLMENIVAAVGIVTASSSNFEMNTILSTLASLKTIPGRVEPVEWLSGPSGAKIIIDYAHTPNGFKFTLPAMRSMTSGKLTVIFGCGGSRDTDKRSQMGEIASRFADRIIVTDDNCRYDDPAVIRKMILEGITRKGGLEVEEIGDRRKAIRRGINLTGTDDTLLILGKGAEPTIRIKDQLIPFLDKEVAESILMEGILEL